MATISSINGISITSVSSFDGIVKASISNIDGINMPSSAPTPTYGYMSGGYTTSNNVATTDRITFSTSVTSANTASNLANATRGCMGISDKTTYGYVAGGYSGASYLAATSRITFSTSATAAATASNLSEQKYGGGHTSDGVTYGYFCGGDSGARNVKGQRMTFSTGAVAANTASNLSQARIQMGNVSDGNTYGYMSGGDTGANPRVNTCDRITFSTSITAASTANNLSSGRNGPLGISDGATYGYMSGGYTGASTRVNTTDRITFSTSTTAAYTTGNLAQVKYLGGSNSDGATYGYFAGGDSGASYTTNTQRITFSTGVVATNTVSNISSARFGLTGLSDYAI